MKKIKQMIIAFCLPITLFILGYYFLGYQIQEENFVISDMKAQYVSLFSYLQDVFLGKETILYSFHKGIGGSMIATFAYYLSSPLNLVVMFFSKGNLPFAIFGLILLKIGLSGGTMYIYLQKHIPENQRINYLFSTAYALMGYTVQYYFHPMWLDAIYLLPLVLLGIDYFVKENKKGAYFGFLLLTITSNFYTGYMVCLFVPIYYFIQIRLQQQKVLSKKTAHFLLISLLATGIAMGLLLPTLLELQNVYRYPLPSFWNIHSIVNYFNELVAKLYIGAHNCKNVLNVNGTNLYCGMFSLVLVYFYFINTTRKEKKTTFFLLLFLLISSIFPILIYIWHGFSMPNYFQNRHSFLFTFVLIVIAANTYHHLKTISLQSILYFFIGYTIISVFLYFRGYQYLRLEEIFLTGIFALLYFILLYVKSRTKQQTIFSFLFIILSFLELLLHIQLTFQGAKANQKFTYLLSNCETFATHSNYRTGSIQYYSGLDGLVCKKQTLTSFISTNKKSIHQFMYHAGYPTTGVTIKDNNTNTIVIDSLLGIGTYLSKRESIGYHPVLTTQKLEEIIVYENPNVLPIGYAIEEIPYDLNRQNAFVYQNDLMMTFSGIKEEPLKQIYEIKDKKTKYVLPVTDGDYYIQIHYEDGNHLRGDIAEVTVNGRKIESETWEEIGVFQARNVKNQIEIIIDHIKDGITATGVSIYQLDEKVFQRQIAQLKNNTLENIDIHKNQFSGSLYIDKPKILFLSIPYDKGWQLTVDGKRKEFISIADTFIGVELEKGMHEINLKYVPTGFYLGIVITFMSSFLSILYFRVCKKT